MLGKRFGIASAAVLVWLAVSIGVAAQPVAGDVVFGKIDTQGPGPGLFWLDSTGKLGTILLTGGGTFPNAVAMHDDNQSFLVCMSGSPDRIQHVAVNGAVTTLIAALPDGSPNGVARDQDGSWLISTSLANALLRFDPVARTVTTVYAHGPETNGIVNSVAVAGDSQEYLLGVWSESTSSAPGGVLRVNRAGTTVTTLASGASWKEISSVGWDPDHGEITVTKFTAPELVRLTSGGALSTVASVTDANAHVLAEDRSCWVAGDGFVRRIDTTNGATIKTLSIPGFVPTAMVIHGNQPLHTTGSAHTGQTLTFHLASARPQDSGKGFFLAFTQTPRPGIPLPDGRMIRLGYDVFLPANLGGLLASYWNGGTNMGILDAQGQATARLTIPTVVPSTAQFRFYALFVTQDITAPSGIGTVSNVVPFTTNL